MIAENYDFITSFFMHFFQIMDCLIFGWIVEKKSFLQSASVSASIVFLVEISCHFTPNFNALNPREKTPTYKVNPVCLIKFWTNQVM
jgi:hypothetical protein